jgi:catechol 2,3-dioxygenase-like lactoylglutathione lyase family enzyme
MAQNDIRKIQTQGVHHITIIGADRQTSIDFWEGVLGMPFIFDQPNLDDPNQGHLYFDPGDGRLITIFTNEDRKPDATPVPEATGSLHHLALMVSARRRSGRWPSGWTRAASRIRGRSTGASWTRSISATRSG